MAQQNFIIRQANQADLAYIVAIYNQSVPTRQATADLNSVTVVQRQAWFDAHGLEKNRPMLVAVANNHKIIGWGALSNLYERPAYRISSEISVYIDETAKGQSVGKAIVTELLKLALSCDIQQVVAKIFAHNQPSLSLFKSFGFEEWGILKQVCDMNDFIADVAMLGKSLK